MIEKLTGGSFSMSFARAERSKRNQDPLANFQKCVQMDILGATSYRNANRYIKKTNIDKTS